MRRVGVLFLFMLILVLTAAPIEVTAADGDLSGDSVTSFSETTDDDTMMYPDIEQAETNQYGFSFGVSLENTISVHSMDCTTDDFVAFNYPEGGAGGATSNTADMLNISSPSDHVYVTWFQCEGYLYHNTLAFYLNNASGGPWTLNYYYGASWTSHATVNFTTSDIGSVVEFDMSSWPYFGTARYEFEFETAGWIELDWSIVTENPDYELDTWAGYTESFANASDCLIMDDEGDDTFSSDGDLLHFESKTDSENDGESVYSNVPSLVGQYLEIRYRLNTTSLAIFAVGTYSSDGGLAGNINWFGMTITTSWTTSKFPINSDTVIESVRLYIYHVTGQPPVDLQVDYLRIGPADEMGWQHDGSTTAGVSAGGGGSISSDGDYLSLVSDADGSTFNISIDVTATACSLSTIYYQFVEIQFHTGDSGKPFRLDSWDGSAYSTVRSYVAIGATGQWWRCLQAVEPVGSYHFRITGYASQTIRLDYIKAYSISNFTVTQTLCDSDDILYVDSGSLVAENLNGINEYIYLDFDPALSVAQASYPVYNLTTPSTAPEFSQYVSEWSAYSDETRGATTSGTVTDIKLKFDGAEILSAIKFIEDGTAPAVVRSSSTPNDPEDDEAVTLSAVITDALEVWSVAFNAIVYPTGFSDVDYSANEQADNLWNYTFSSLDAGYYCFKIIASDGANTNALTEYAYIELTVREAAIMVEEITLIGAGEDFSMMTFSARINRDCSYTIYEESASSAESDTHTGSVTAPSFNLAWTKLDVDDANVNFTIRFTSGSLTYNYTSQYQVAQTTFYVSTVTQMVSLDTVTVTGRITKLGAYQVYDGSDVLQSYGSIEDLDFKIQFTRWGGYDEQNHDFAIKFTNGTQTCWYNSSFYAFKKPVVAAFQTTDPNVLYAFQASFWTAVMIFFVMLMIGIDFYRRNK